MADIGITNGSTGGSVNPSEGASESTTPTFATYKIYKGNNNWETIHFQTNAGQVKGATYTYNSKGYARFVIDTQHHTINDKVFSEYSGIVLDSTDIKLGTATTNYAATSTIRDILASLDTLAHSGGQASTDLDTHKSDTNNPHEVTASQVGLGDVVNKGMDDVATKNSDNYVKSGGVFTGLNERVPTTRKINNQALSSDVTLCSGDIPYENKAGSKTVKSKLDELTSVASGKTNTYVVSYAKNSGLNSQKSELTFSVDIYDEGNNPIDKDLLKVGDIFLVKEPDVPDRWVSDLIIVGTKVSGVQLSKMETTAIDLSTYVSFTDLDNWTGSTNIATVGTVTSGTWNGTAITNDYIATALTSKTYNGLSITTGTNTFTLTRGTDTNRAEITVPAKAIYTLGAACALDKSTVVGSSSTDTQAPTAKAVYSHVQARATKVFYQSGTSSISSAIVGDILIDTSNAA